MMHMYILYMLLILGGSMVDAKNFEIAGSSIAKKVLANGLTVLVREVHTIPKVSVQLWYNVGSKDEGIGERGIAHLIEHMIFKGTKKLSESDINMITHMLSGSCNAFTSYDYTGYLFNFPKQHWREALSIMADCMRNCTFKEDMLSSEMKAVIQELKMYRDNYTSSLFEKLISTIFDAHPYHHPIIGYKEDLWNASSELLKNFYYKHYIPNNAALVVVGDVSAQEVFDCAEQYFGHIPADLNYKKAVHPFSYDIISKSVTLYRDLQQPMVIFAFLVPGINSKQDNVLHLLSWILGKERSSRLYKKLVDELHLATSVGADSEDLFEHGIFFIYCEPKNIEDIPTIERYIKEEIENILKHGIKEEELDRAIKQTQMSMYNLLENFEQQANQIGKFFWATGDESYIFKYLSKPKKILKQEMLDLVKTYLRPTVMHKGLILPLPASEKERWSHLQDQSDIEDNQILAARIRHSPVEPVACAKDTCVKEPEPFAFPRAHTIKLTNGLKVLYCHNPNTPKVDIVLQLKARSYYDRPDKQGLYTFVMHMLTEGTDHYTAEELAHAIESRGMSLDTYPGGACMSMLNEDLMYGLTILEDVLSAPLFNAKQIEKVRAQMITDIINYWDEPWDFSGQLLKDALYKGHPYSMSTIGKKESVESIKQADLIEFFKKNISPDGAVLAIVGDLSNVDLPSVLETTIGRWKGPQIQDIQFPTLSPVESKEINYPINRDQTVLCFAGLSIDRKNPDYDKLLLFDQIFGSGVLGSMGSRLFQLREQSGLFYRINGSLIVGSGEQPGIVLVKTLVSLDRLAEAEKVIKHVIETTADSITQQELEDARRAVISSLVDYFASNMGVAQMFLFLDKYNFPANFFDERAKELSAISLDEIKNAVKRVMNSDKLITLRVGRIPKAKTEK
jgi:zinc protease